MGASRRSGSAELIAFWSGYGQEAIQKEISLKIENIPTGGNELRIGREDR